MGDISKYVGIPHRFNKAGFDGCDCLGLVRLFYKEHGYSPSFYDEFEVTKENYNSQSAWTHLYKYLEKHFDKETDPSKLKVGDIVIFSVLGDIHFGIIADENGRLLAGQIPAEEGKSQSTIYRKSWWLPHQRAMYRRRE